jgi:hypothetical protein
MRCRVRHHDRDSVTAAGAYGTRRDRYPDRHKPARTRQSSAKLGRGERDTDGWHLMRDDRERAMPLPGVA